MPLKAATLGRVLFLACRLSPVACFLPACQNSAPDQSASSINAVRAADSAWEKAFSGRMSRARWRRSNLRDQYLPPMPRSPPGQRRYVRCSLVSTPSLA